LRTTYLRTALYAACSLIPLLASSACGGNEPTSASDDDATSGEGEPSDGDDSNAETGSGECNKEGASTSCSCTNGDDGTRTCRKGKYTSCTCDEPDSGSRTPGQPLCKPGYYTGSFKGKYRPGAFGFGLFPSGFEVDIEGGMSFFDQSLPPLAFTLTEEASGPAGEFATFTVGGGCMQGLATAVLITQSPFVAKLTGNLDCATGEFEGELEGYYTLIGIPGADFTFRGPLTAKFDLQQVSLDEGAWTVNEPASLSGEPQGGGNGTWDAKFTADRAPERGVDPCSTIISGGDGGVTMIGPGAPTTPSDGGTSMADDAADAGAP
jgi:hypothetical protein